MSSTYWIKLYLEILDDPKMATLPDRLWRRIIELFLCAGRLGGTGQLPETRQLAWMLRMDTDDLDLDLKQIATTGIIQPNGSGWLVIKFAKRQAPSSPTERVKLFRERQKKQQYYGNETQVKRNVTQINRLTESESEEEGNGDLSDLFAGGQPPSPPPAPALSIDAVICNATGLAAIPPREYNRIEQVQSLIDAYGEEAVTQAMHDASQKWISTKRKDGSGTYRITNFGWVDWAQEILMGNVEPEKPISKMTHDEFVQHMLKKEKQNASNALPPQ